MLKRVCWPLAGAIVIGMAALLLERLIRLLDLFANRGGPLTLILKMLGNLVPHYLAIAIPAAFFVGILYATLRLSNDSELDVMRASGLSLRRLAAPMLVMAVVLTVASAIILGFLQPLHALRLSRPGLPGDRDLVELGDRARRVLQRLRRQDHPDRRHRRRRPHAQEDLHPGDRRARATTSPSPPRPAS